MPSTEQEDRWRNAAMPVPAMMSDRFARKREIPGSSPARRPERETRERAGVRPRARAGLGPRRCMA
jgi:hypothetical protein